MIKLKSVLDDEFKKYGDVLIWPQKSEGNFQVLVDVPNGDGWRLAISRIPRRRINKMGRHSNSRESFEPLSGISVLVTAIGDVPEMFEAFVIEQPVCLFQNVWHATTSLSQFALVKIAENHLVNDESKELEHPLVITL